jgi:hypothetical protein
MAQLGFPDGLTQVGYAYSVFVLVSFPGVQPAGVASLNVKLDRVAADGTRSVVGAGSTLVPQGTLNQELDVSGDVPVSATLAPGDRLVADVFVSGVEASNLYFSYDDGTYASGILLEPAPTGPSVDVAEAPAAGLLAVTGFTALLARSRRRRRSRT